MDAIAWAAAGTGFTFFMTALGAATVFLFRSQITLSVQRLFLGFAAGVMIAASVWSLLIPSIEQTEDVYRQATLGEHQKILAAILRRDAIGARFCMAAHLNTSRDFFARKAEAEEKKKQSSPASNS